MRTVVVLVAFALAGCPAQPPKPPPTEEPDASRPTGTCASACENMRRLGCELGKPTPNGASCESVCDRVQRENGGAGFNVHCLARASACAGAEACR